MYLGRYRVGDAVPLTLQTVNTSDTATAPDRAPYAFLWSPSALVATIRMPIHAAFRTTGLFKYLLRLGHKFAVGNYNVVYRYDIASAREQHVDVFDIVDGGRHDGPILSMHTFDRPDSVFILQHVASGRILRGRNPVIE
jgi:hypothetical protein